MFFGLYGIQLLQGSSNVPNDAAAQHCSGVCPPLYFAVAIQELCVRKGENDEAHEAVTILRFEEFLCCCKRFNSAADGVGGLFSLGLEITMSLFVQCSLQIPHSSAFPFMSIRSL